ncbi:Complex 1 LYR protein [Trinorchestia longiramus]|nr:Complex 1 LYR protein [Trinorchestia longiramus]
MLWLPACCARASGLGSSSNVMSLKRFMLRSEALKLYRAVLRDVRKLPPGPQREELTQWARAEFEANKHHQDEETIRGLIMMGNRQHKELKHTIALAIS